MKKVLEIIKKEGLGKQKKFGKQWLAKKNKIKFRKKSKDVNKTKKKSGRTKENSKKTWKTKLDKFVKQKLVKKSKVWFSVVKKTNHKRNWKPSAVRKRRPKRETPEEQRIFLKKFEKQLFVKKRIENSWRSWKALARWKK